VARDGRDLALYAKMHLIALLGENANYEPGDRLVPFDLGRVRAASLICYDLRFPEIFRAVVNECGLILVIASWPAPRQLHWDVLLQARAIESQCFVVGVNRVGEGGGYTFSGGSAVIDPLGQVIARAVDNETLLVADLDLAQIVQVRENFPFLRDRRPDLFLEAARGATKLAERES
jgi:predicted amidohydrolase